MPERQQDWPAHELPQHLLPGHPLVSIDIERLDKIRKRLSSLQLPDFDVGAPVPFGNTFLVNSIVAHARKNDAAFLVDQHVTSDHYKVTIIFFPCAHTPPHHPPTHTHKMVTKLLSIPSLSLFPSLIFFPRYLRFIILPLLTLTSDPYNKKLN